MILRSLNSTLNDQQHGHANGNSQLHCDRDLDRPGKSPNSA
jgi:hypothetical protein